MCLKHTVSLEHTKKSIKRSENINEMQAILLSIYNGPSPDLFSRALTIESRNISDIKYFREYIFRILDRLETLSVTHIKKIKC